MTCTKLFRRNVAIVVLNTEGHLLACRRSDRFHTWQLPQGGIEEGETEEAAMYRELREEIGTDLVDIIGRLEEPIRYDWPEHLYYRGYHGQEQSYFLVRLRPQAEICLETEEPEFDCAEWVTVGEFFSRLDAGFKTDAYRQAIDELLLRYPGTVKED
ncbi:MAG: RNA pyrophosphohydrolase [Bdellovibrionales bacterium]|nr:RNA pyrophosphohydrolase [Bdellovibrionales bacterium]